MSKEGIEKLNDLLSRIVIFDDEYKNKILDKAANLNESGVQKINDLLVGVENWQRTIFEKKLKADPEFSQKLLDLARDKKKVLLQLKNDILAEKDREKISTVLSFIEKL